MVSLILLAACRSPDDVASRGPEPGVTPAPATLRRLTTAEYQNTLVDLLGDGLVLPTSLEPDLDTDGLFSVGAGQAAISPLGVEQYETASYLIAGQVMGDEALRASVVPCMPAGMVDDACAEAFVRSFGRLAWRRAPTDDEVAGLVGIAGAAATTLGDFWDGLQYPLAAILQSPSFLYRVELGEGGAFTPIELASRMSYLVWNGPPDEELLERAEDGSLADPDVRRDEVARMLADPRARRGVRTFFDQLFALYAVPDLVKDPVLFVHWSNGIGDAAREESLSMLSWLVFDRDGDIRDLVNTRTTFVDRSLAALYEVAAPERDGFGPIELPADGPRAGLLGEAGFLAKQAHSTSTSVTRRGKFVRTQLLCQPIPPPPANVDTSIPPPSPDAPTMRDIVAAHLADPACASCHQVTDPVGLGFEQFDGIGSFRTEEPGLTPDQGYPVDPSGQLDGDRFRDARALEDLIHDHPDFPKCLVSNLFAYGEGHGLASGEGDVRDWLVDGLAEHGHRWQSLLADFVASDAFAVAGENP